MNQSSIHPLTENLWMASRPLKFWGVEVGTKMTVIRLRDGGLFIHSPVALNPQTLFELQTLGKVRFVVAPNCLHHLFVRDYFKVFPEAKIYAAPGLQKKRKDLPFFGVLGNEPEPSWKDELDQVLAPGIPLIHTEAVFFHRPSRSLILTDLAFHITKNAPPLTRLTGLLLGTYEKFGPDPILKYYVRRRDPLKEAVQKILSWNFDRILLAHGKIIERGGKEVFEKAFGPLLIPRK